MSRKCNIDIKDETWVNSIRYQTKPYTTKPNQSVEETEDFLNHTALNWKLKFDKEQDREIYYLKESDISMKKRVSDVNVFEGLETVNSKIQAKGGTYVHGLLQEALDELVENGNAKKSFIKISKELGESNATQLVNGVKEIYEFAKLKQKDINPQGSFKILTEQTVINPKKNRGGTIDVLVLFSNNTAGIFDYKTIMPSRDSLDSKNRLLTNLVKFYKRENYEKQLGAYKEDLKEIYGVKDVVFGRVVPIRVDYKLKKRNESKPGDRLEDKILKIEMGKDTSKKLLQFPVLPEKTRFEGINRYIEVKLEQIKTLNNRLEKTSLDNRAKILNKIDTINETIQEILADNNILSVGKDLFQTINYINANIDSLSLDEVIDYSNEMKYYNNIKKIFKERLNELKSIKTDESREKYVNTVNYLTAIQSESTAAILSLESRLDNISRELIGDEYYDEVTGKLKPTKKLSTYQKYLSTLREIKHPVFKAFKRIYDAAFYDYKKDFKDFNERLSEKYFKVKELAKRLGMSENDIVNKLINFKTGNYYSKYSDKFYDEVDNAFELKNKTFFNKYYKTDKTKEEIEDEVAKKRDIYEKYYRERYYNKDLYTDKEFNERVIFELKRWDSNNNLVLENGMFNKKVFFKYYKINEQAVKEFETEEYKFINSYKELKEYYEFIIESNEMFRDILGVPKSIIPNNFFANVRKDLHQKVVSSGLSGVAEGFNEVLDNLDVREEDIEYGVRNPVTNQFEKNIPKMFINKFKKDKDGMQTEKSYDLLHSTLLFAKMAYNYKYMSAVEASSLALKNTLATSSSLETNSKGKVIKSSIGIDVKTTEGESSEEVKMFENFLDYYLYGIRFKEKGKTVNILGKSINTTKALNELKTLHVRKSLSFAFIPAAAAAIQGHLSVKTEADKGVAYDNNQWKASIKYLTKNYSKADELAKKLDVYTESIIDELVFKGKKKGRKIIDSRTHFTPLRSVDESVSLLVMTSMLQNYGITKEGKIRRLENIPNGKPILNIETSEAQQLTKEQEIFIRNAIKEEVKKVIGTNSSDDINQAHLSLVGSLLMTYRTWMPGIINERFKGESYNEYLDSVEMGRYTNLFKKFNKEPDVLMLNWFSGVVAPEAFKLATEITTFGILSPFSNIKNNKLDINNLSDTQLEKLKLRYYKFLAENLGAESIVSFEQYVLANQRHLKGAVGEFRKILSIAALVFMLGFEGDDDEPLYAELGWFGRLSYKVLNRAETEISFTMNPNEFIGLIKNPIPLAGLITDATKTISNTSDEFRDLILGENDNKDKTPLGYYSTKWIYGVNQARKVFDFVYENDSNVSYTFGNIR